jgi:hypothetical protein
MFKLDKKKMIAPGVIVSYNKKLYKVIGESGSNISINDGKDEQNVGKNRVELVINEKTLKSLIDELNKKSENLKNKLHQMELVGKDKVDKYTIASSSIIEIAENSKIEKEERIAKINEIIKDIRHFENGDRVKIISNRKNKLEIGSEWIIARASNPLVLHNPSSGNKQNVFKSEVDIVGETKKDIVDDLSIINTDIEIYKKILDYIVEEEIEEFDDGQYLSWYLVNIMNSDKKDSEKTRDIARIINSSLNKIDVSVLKQLQD